MNLKKLIAGIDVSKDSLDIYYNTQRGKGQFLKISNDRKGHRALLQKLGSKRTYVMEASGPYFLRLAFYLKTSGVDVRVENPIKIKRFIQMQLERNKSDTKDARWIFHYGMERKGRTWKPPAANCLKCKAILNSVNLFTRQITQISNQLHALKFLPLPCIDVQNSLEKIKVCLQKEIGDLEKILEHFLMEWKGEQFKSIFSIPGLGKRAVALLMVCTDGFTRVNNHRQLIALAGLVPREYTSGSSIRKKKGICKMGNVQLRNVLYMCSLSAIRHNPACKELYERLKAKGKKSKVALIAVCNKLLKQAFAIATKGSVYHSYNVSQL